MSRYIYILLLVNCLFTFKTPALSGGNKIEYYTVLNGLSQNGVLNIFKDSRGFMWFSTEDGLNRFDGYEFKLFMPHKNDPYSINSNRAVDIVEDNNGNLWMGTSGGGVNKYERRSGKFIHYKVGSNYLPIISNEISTIDIDQSGFLWIGFSTSGIMRFNPADKSTDWFHYDRGLNGNANFNLVNAFLEDANGGIWVGTLGAGLFKFNPEIGAFDEFRLAENGIEATHIKNIFQDSYGIIWVSTQNGLWSYDYMTATIERYEMNNKDVFTIASNIVGEITEDQEKNLYVATDGGGLNVFVRKLNKFKRIPYGSGKDNLINHARISALFCDPAGILWIGTMGGGINKIPIMNNKFNNIFHDPNNSNSLIYRDVFPLFFDDENNLWVGTSGGLDKIDLEKNIYTHYVNDPLDPNSISSNLIRDLWQDSEGYIWVGSYNGLNKLNPATGEFEHFFSDPKDPETISDNIPFRFAGDKNSCLWIGTKDGGLNKFDTKTGKAKRYVYNPSNEFSLGSNKIYSILVDGDFLWIGTYDKGLYRLDVESEKFYYVDLNKNKIDNLCGTSIFALYKGSNSNLWIGTSGCGLIKYNNETGSTKFYTSEAGLPNQSIYSIIEDHEKNLWLSHNEGLSKLNMETEKIENFSLEDGLQSKEFNAESCVKSPTGELFFGGINGITHFYPEQIKGDELEGKLQFIDFQLLYKSVPYGFTDDGRQIFDGSINEAKEIILSHNDYVFSIEFANISYFHPNEIKYLYKLENFEKSWNNVGTRRFATYTNLFPGEYTLIVKAFLKDGIWSDQEAKMKIIITPPFYHTWWFRIAGGLAIVGLILLIIKSRTIRAEKQKANLEKMVLEKTRILNETNLELKSTKAEIQKDKEYLSITLKSIVEGVIPTDTEGKILFSNKSVNEIFQVEDPLGKYIWELFEFLEDDADKEMFKFFPVHSESQVAKFNRKKITINSGTDELKILEISSSPIKDINEKLRGMVFIISDITRNVHIENQFALSQKMESVGQLAAGIAHEMNTPLQYVGDNTTFLEESFSAFHEMISAILELAANEKTLNKEDYFEKLKEVTEGDYLSHLLNEIPIAIKETKIGIEKVSQIVLSMKDFAHPGSKAKSFSDINHGIDVTANISRNKWKYQADLQLKLDENLPPVLCYQDEINQVILNMIINSVHSIEEKIENESSHKGIISVETKYDDENISIIISDNGEGIPEEVLPKIFDLFFTTKEVGKGSGQGLAIAHDIIANKHNGQIKVDSAKGKGTKFTLTIPISTNTGGDDEY